MKNSNKKKLKNIEKNGKRYMKRGRKSWKCKRKSLKYKVRNGKYKKKKCRNSIRNYIKNELKNLKGKRTKLKKYLNLSQYETFSQNMKNIFKIYFAHSLILFILQLIFSEREIR